MMKHVSEMKIKDCTDILSGFAFKSELFNNSGNGIPLVRIRDVGRDYSETYYPGEYSIEFILNNGDIIIGMDGEFRISEWKGGKALLNQRVCKIIPDGRKIHPRYMLYLLPKELKKIEDATPFVTVKHLSVNKIKDIQIPLPPLATQQKIAATLDAADAYRQQTKALIAKYDQLAQSLFLDMFGDPVRNEKGWEKKKLEDILEFLTSGSRGWAKYYSENGDLFLRIQNVGYDCLRLDEIIYIQTPSSAEANRTKVKTGDVILSITADLGRTAVIPDDFPDAYINQHLAILRLKGQMNPRFLSAYIATKGGQSFFNQLNKGGVKAGLNFTDIKSYPIFTPSIALQNLFAERIQHIEAQKQQARASLQKAEELFNSLLQRAFAP